MSKPFFDMQRRQPRQRFTIDQSMQYFYDVCSAVEYLHGLQPDKVIHRDLKPENVLVTADGTNKLADFGWSRFCPRHEKLNTFCGTLEFLTPEMIMGTEYDEKIDMWALGVMLYEFLTGRSPFRSDCKENTCRCILRVQLKFPANFSTKGSLLEAQDLITNLCQRKPEQRLTAVQSKAHPFLYSVSVGP